MWLEPFLLSEVYFSVVSWFEPRFFMVVSYLHRLHSISNQQSATSHAGTARWGEKAWQSIESQPTEMLGVWCHPYKPADQGDHPATRFHQEKIRPPQKKHHANFGHICKSYGIFTCVILLHYSLYQLLSPVCPSTVCQGSPFFIAQKEHGTWSHPPHWSFARLLVVPRLYISCIWGLTKSSTTHLTYHYAI